MGSLEGTPRDEKIIVVIGNEALNELIITKPLDLKEIFNTLKICLLFSLKIYFKFQ